MDKRSVSVVCTSFNRVDLLEKTLDSFFQFNTFPIQEFIVRDDSGEWGCNDSLIEKFPSVDFRYNEERIGQIESIDRLYSDIEPVRYIFHMEEDWEFFRGSFIEHSLDVLERRQDIFQVWLRDVRDTNGHPVDSDYFDICGRKYSLLNRNHRGWHGFTFNPTLIRMGAYYQHGPWSSIAKFNGSKPWQSEQKIGKYMYSLGYSSAIHRKYGYVKHIGKGRTIKG